jgi:assimilatory nitrate reductase catalytic subunit
VERDFPTNRGGLCQKGWTAAELLEDAGRLRTPLVRNNRSEPLRAGTWDEALHRITRAIEQTQAAHGKHSIGVFGGGSLTNEKAYLLGKFARVALRTSQIDYNGRFCMSSAAAACIKAFGIDRGVPFPLADISQADTILLAGSNLAETMPPVMHYFQEQRRRGGALIVVDPRATLTAASSTLHLQITPGTDAALANGLLHIAVKEGYIDEDFISARTKGFDLVRRTVSSYWPARVERITGIPEQQLQRAACLLGEAGTAIILTARGPEQQSHGVDNALAFINLALALGKSGKPHCGYGCLTGQGNGQGGREHGQKADQLPGYRRLDNPEHRAHIARVWEWPNKTCPSRAAPPTKCSKRWDRRAACARYWCSVPTW